MQRRANGGFDYLAEKRSNLGPPLVPPRPRDAGGEFCSMAAPDTNFGSAYPELKKTTLNMKRKDHG